MSTEQTSKLIAIGRDREAVAAALGGTVNGVQQLDQVAPMLVGIVSTLDDAELARPTPCAKFNVAGVLEHMVSGASAFAPAFRGDGSSPDAPVGSVIERWNAAMTELMDAVHRDSAPGATIASPFGEVTGAYFIRYLALDGLTHAWDMATATGRPLAPPDDLVEQIDAFARQLLTADMRDGDTFAAATDPPPDASPIERLVAFTGRTVPR